MGLVTVLAFAKINLSLRVGELRSDGFHELQTIFQSIDLADRISVQTCRGPFELRCSLTGVPTDRTNLVWKAAQALWEASGRTGDPRNTLVILDKRIPMQAGLGGGSSDAAAALLCLRRMWKVRLADEQIQAIAARLGSDVPCFLVGGTALGLGRGDEVYPLEDLPPYWVVLVFPPFGVATGDAYRWLDDDRRAGTSGRNPVSGSSCENGSRSLFPGASLRNDLEQPVVTRHPLIGMLIERLKQRGALMAAMSGSGSTVFAVFKSARQAEAAVRALRTPGLPNQHGVRALMVRFRRRLGRPLGRTTTTEPTEQ